MTVEKKIKGLKIHILVDTQGFLLKVIVHPANIPDCSGGKLVLKDILKDYERLKVIFADGGYQGLPDWISVDSKGKLKAEIVKRLNVAKLEPDDPLQPMLIEDEPVIEKPVKMNNNDGKFPILKWRWIVERTLSWLSKSRRLSKIYERLTSSVKAFCNIAMSRIMLRRLTTGS
jgi:putative transposase